MMIDHIWNYHQINKFLIMVYKKYKDFSKEKVVFNLLNFLAYTKLQRFKYENF